MAQAILAIVLLVIGFQASAVTGAPVSSWEQLSADQQSVLAPLQKDWDRMDNTRKRKALAIAARYPTLKAEQQARVRKRLADWYRLTPEERKAARTKYKSIAKLEPNKRAEMERKWHEYQRLPAEQKRNLKAARSPVAPGNVAGSAPVQTTIDGSSPNPRPQ